MGLGRRAEPDVRPLESLCRRKSAPLPLPFPRITHPGRQRGPDAGDFREEPGAGKPHARICEGRSRMAELLDHDHELLLRARRLRGQAPKVGIDDAIHADFQKRDKRCNIRRNFGCVGY